jgi:hypothetical protein
MNPAEHGPRREGSSEQVVPLPRLPWDAPQRPPAAPVASRSVQLDQTHGPQARGV